MNQLGPCACSLRLTLACPHSYSLVTIDSNCGQFASIGKQLRPRNPFPERQITQRPSGPALFTVDFLDTLPLEVNILWGGNSKISLVKILYFVSRYGMLLMMAMQLWFLMSIPVSENAYVQSFRHRRVQLLTYPSSCAVMQYIYFMFVELPPTCASGSPSFPLTYAFYDTNHLNTMKHIFIALLLIRAWAICSRNHLILGLGIVLMLFPPAYDFYVS